MCWGKDAYMFASSILSLLILPKEQKEMKRVMVTCFGYYEHSHQETNGKHLPMASTQLQNTLICCIYTRESTVQPSQVRCFLDTLYVRFTCCLVCTKLPDVGTWNMRTLDMLHLPHKNYESVHACTSSWSLSEFPFDSTEITNKIMSHSISLTKRKETTYLKHTDTQWFQMVCTDCNT